MSVIVHNFRSWFINQVWGNRAGAILAAAIIPGLCAPALAGQAVEGPPASRSFRSLVSEVSQVRDVQFVRELQLEWNRADASGAGDGGTQAFTLVDERVVPGGLRRERRPQLSYDRLVVVVRDSLGRELDWRLIRNPAILRAEVPGPDGRLTGRVIELDAVELSIAIPNIAAADHIELYRPRWTGTEYALDSLVEVLLRNRR